MNRKSRAQIVKECASAVVSCWNHYVDVPLTENQIHNIELVLSTTALPYETPTDHWRAYADDYDKRMSEEEESQ